MEEYLEEYDLMEEYTWHMGIQVGNIDYEFDGSWVGWGMISFR